jgi:hypothetical protein
MSAVVSTCMQRGRVESDPRLVVTCRGHVISKAVREVTHIAPADAEGKIIDEPVIQEGVIGIPPPALIGLCAGVTNAPYATTTEVYPDSPRATDEQCNRAQVVAISAALDYIMQVGGKEEL